MEQVDLQQRRGEWIVEFNFTVPGWAGVRDSKLGDASPVLVFNARGIDALISWREKPGKVRRPDAVGGTRSSGNGACVEVARLHSATAMRDSKDPAGPALTSAPLSGLRSPPGYMPASSAEPPPR